MDSLSNTVKVKDGWKAAALMVVVQFVYAAANILLKLAANDGMSLFVLIAYRFIFATAFIVPLALFFERGSLNKLNGKVLFQAFLCGLFGGSLLFNLYVQSLALMSATYATAIMNLTPAVTYILAISLGLERMDLGSPGGKAKVLGTCTGIGGAMILTFCKGKRFQIWTTHIDLMHHVALSHDTTDSLFWGCLLVLFSCISYSLWLIVQARMTEAFPWHYTNTALMSIMSTIQSVIFALCMERDWNQWKLGWNIRLLTAAFTGTLASGVVCVIIAWCVHKKGPLFVSIFGPLMLVLMTLGESLLLEEILHMGSVIGMMLIAFGLYIVLWGKSRETDKAESEI